MLQFYQVLPDDVDVAVLQEPHFAKLDVEELFSSLISGESPLFFDLKPFVLSQESFSALLLSR